MKETEKISDTEVLRT